jgi:hypothetical protein
MKADGVEDFHIDSTADDEPFDEVEAVEFRSAIGQVRQMPSFRRRRPANASSAIEGTAALEDAADGSQGRDAFDAVAAGALGEFATDGSGPVLAEVTGFAELLPESEDEILDPLWSARGRASSTAWAIGPVDAIEALTLCSIDPLLDRPQTDTEFLRNDSHGPTTADDGDHPPPLLFNRVFWITGTPSMKSFPTNSDYLCLTFK